VIRITYLITDSGVGGTEKMLAELILNLDRSRFEPDLIVLKEPGATAKMLMEKGINVRSMSLPGRVSFGYGFRLPGALIGLKRILAEERPEILHCFLFQANFMGRIAARCAGVPVNISSLRVEERERLSHVFFERISGFMVTAYTAVCENVREFGIQKMGIPGDRIVTIANGITPELYQSGARDMIRKEFGINKDTPLIGTIGRLHHQKGMDILLKAAAEARERLPQMRVMIVGEGPEGKSLKGLARELGISDSVIFTGIRRDIPDILAALDLFVLPSRWEGMPNVILEAMAAGRPVVAADTGGAQELVSHEETGLLVPAEDVNSLSEAVIRLLSNPPDLEKMAERARGRVKDQYSILRMVDQNQELYERLLKNVRNMR
jgi:glycosyltransferase involved in cell wall biosynthesis